VKVPDDNDLRRDPMLRSLNLWRICMNALVLLLLLSGIFRIWQLAIVLVLVGTGAFVWQRNRSVNGRPHQHDDHP
jgi:hypothetical protein